MKIKFWTSEIIFYVLMIMLAAISIALIIYGDFGWIKEKFPKTEEIGAALLSVATGAITARLFIHFSSDNTIKRQKTIKFQLLSSLYEAINIMSIERNQTVERWKKSKIECSDAIITFLKNASEENVKEEEYFLNDIYNKYLNPKYRVAISSVEKCQSTIKDKIKKLKKGKLYYARFEMIIKYDKIKDKIDR